MDSLYLSQEQFQDIFKNHLKIETYSKPIESLFSIRNRRRIDYQPYYQRNYVWDATKASYFIESIILGTEIPPLIFFNNGESMEIIDGRQRFETIKRFYDSDLTLKRKGLFILKNFEKKNFGALPDDICDVFLDSTLRIIEFEIVNEPKLDPLLQDKVKKEIFGRYNSGITPLKKAEIETAVYVDDAITTLFKDNLQTNEELFELYDRVFFRIQGKEPSRLRIENLLSFIRRSLVIHRLPITYYAQGRKNEVLERLYEQLVDTGVTAERIFSDLNSKVEFVDVVSQDLERNGVGHNRLRNECLLWGLNVVENEGVALPKSPPTAEFLNAAAAFFKSCDTDAYTELDRHFYGPVVKRFNTTADFLEKHLDLDLTVYRAATDESRSNVKSLLESRHDEAKLSELESLRLNKPDPSRVSIEDICNMMKRRRFLVRPPYQRSEVINLSKASSIIESILLGIALPVIFVYKRQNGVSEVIDGQQRILTILGFLGEEYMDEAGESVKTKNDRFKLRQLKILSEFQAKRFHDLPQDAQDKILDFELFVVTIEEKLNPEFDPVDLFIRLNDKPYPIKEHSFEMWNSWVDKDVITSIRDLTSKHKPWFYVRSSNKTAYRDRMENEELFAALSFLTYRTESEGGTHLDVYQKDQRLNARIKAKKDVTSALMHVSEDSEKKKKFLSAIKSANSLVAKTKLVLLNKDTNDDELAEYLDVRLTALFYPDREKVNRRSFQDFYVLWLCLHTINKTMVAQNRLAMYGEIQDVFRLFRSVPEDQDGPTLFTNSVGAFHKKYAIAERETISAAERDALLEQQDNQCGISGAPIFRGDDVHVDHKNPLSRGGTNDNGNLSATHAHENLRKGAKPQPTRDEGK